MNRLQAFLFLSRCLSCGNDPDSRREQLRAEMIAGGIVWERVVEVASAYWMTLALYWELGEKRLLSLLPAGLLDYFDAMHELNRVRNQRILEQTGELSGLLNRIGVEPILLKGAGHLASGMYPDPAVRFMADIDLLVPGDRAVECWRLLISSGYRFSASHGNLRIEDTLGDWPELGRDGRIAVVEMHRAAEWNHVLSAPELYRDAEPLEIPGGRVRIPGATTRMIFVMAHSYVQNSVVSLPFGPLLRDLYDATLLQRRLGGEIAWQRVTDAFRAADRMEALRIGCMMWKRLLSETPPCAMDPPEWGWIYWQRCGLNIRSTPVTLLCECLIDNAGLLPRAISMTPAGKRFRRRLSQPGIARQKLETALGRYRVASRAYRW